MSHLIWIVEEHEASFCILQTESRPFLVVWESAERRKTKQEEKKSTHKHSLFDSIIFKLRQLRIRLNTEKVPRIKTTTFDSFSSRRKGISLMSFFKCFWLLKEELLKRDKIYPHPQDPIISLISIADLCRIFSLILLFNIVMKTERMIILRIVIIINGITFV